MSYLVMISFVVFMTSCGLTKKNNGGGVGRNYGKQVGKSTDDSSDSVKPPAGKTGENKTESPPATSESKDPSSSSKNDSELTVLSCSPPGEDKLALFDSGEHVCLGDSAFMDVCSKTNLDCAMLQGLKRKDGKKAYSYGELVALSGDFYGAPSDIFDMTDSLFGDDVDDVLGYFRDQKAIIGSQLQGSPVDFPTLHVEYSWNIPSYVTQAIKNYDHFGWNNVIAYLQYHKKALDLALAARKLAKTNPNEADMLLRQAFYHNAFADHFLSDAFATGHIRVPRKQIIKYGPQASLNEKQVGNISKILHDFDGDEESRLHVVNARGDKWITVGDGHLFRVDKENKRPNEHFPLGATKASLQEIFTAYTEGKLPQKEYAALWWVPFPDKSKEGAITTRFYPDMSAAKLDKLFEATDWYGRIPGYSKVTKQDIITFFKDLPQIMKEFRQDITADLASNKEISKRVPAAYIEAYKVVE